METTGSRLIQIRKEHGLQAVDIARRFDCAPSMVSNWENDVRVPQIDTLLRYAELGKVSVDWLLCRTDVRNADQELETRNYQPDIIEMANKLRDIPNGDRREIITLVDDLIDVVRTTKIAKNNLLYGILERRGGESAVREFEERRKIKLVRPPAFALPL
jgi:transcriptional regulator with XRE-family HTH domain